MDVLEAGDVVLDLTELAVGQCFDAESFADETSTDYGTITVADCAGPHDAEIFHVAQYPAEAGAPFPGDDALFEHVEVACIPAFGQFVGIDYYESRLDFDVFVPTEATWRKYDDHQITCFVIEPDFTELDGTKAGAAE